MPFRPQFVHERDELHWQGRILVPFRGRFPAIAWLFLLLIASRTAKGMHSSSFIAHAQNHAQVGIARPAAEWSVPMCGSTKQTGGLP